MVPQALVLRGDNIAFFNILVVRGRAVIMCMVSGEALAIDLPQRAVVLVMVGIFLIALQTVEKW
jgi:hypothetical protein